MKLEKTQNRKTMSTETRLIISIARKQNNPIYRILYMKIECILFRNLIAIQSVRFYLYIF